MDNLSSLYIMPHPPIIIPEIGKGEEQRAFKTIEGCKRAAKGIKALKPEVIIVITPHGPLFQDAVCVNTNSTLTGSFSKFGCTDVNIKMKNHMDLSKRISKEIQKNGTYVLELEEDTQRQYDISPELDHGVLVPLYYILKEYDEFNLVHITIGMLSPEELYKCGMAVKRAINAAGKKTCVVASADLSHKLTKNAPAGYDERGREYDAFVVDCIRNQRYEDFLTIDQKLLERAGQCGHKPVTMLLGLLEQYECDTEVFSYEGPFGVGYMAAKLEPKKKIDKSVLGEYLKLKSQKIGRKIQNEDSYVSLARKAIEKYIKEKEVLKIPEGLPEEMYNQRNGVFVSLKKNGSLRGCIGTIGPAYDNVAEEIIENAIKSAGEDPRFNPVEENEIDELDISVDVLKDPEDITMLDELDVKKYGVIVKSGYRKGLLLPNLEGVDTVEQQVDIALRKASIGRHENYTLQRFEVIRHQ